MPEEQIVDCHGCRFSEPISDDGIEELFHCRLNPPVLTPWKYENGERANPHTDSGSWVLPIVYGDSVCQHWQPKPPANATTDATTGGRPA